MAADFDPSEMQANLRDVRERLRAAALEAVTEAINDVGEKSDAEVPTDTKTLRKSKRIRVQIVGDKISATIGYGSGEAAGYAQDQHEDFGNSHDDGGPKFLERPLMQARRRVLADIAERVRKELG